MAYQVGYLDIENDEIEKYVADVLKKVDVCKIPPRGRFSIRDGGRPRYDRLVCSDKMGGKQTGIAALYCKNCVVKAEKNRDS